MKKSSIFVTLLLVVALMFAVSCPNDKTTVSVKYDVTQTATVGEATDISFVLETNGEFTEKAKEISSIDVDASAFDESAENKADVSVSSVTLSDDKKEATVTVSLTPKKEIADGELQISILEVTTDADAIVKGVKEKITMSGSNKVKITVTKAKAKVSVKTAVSDNVTVGTAKEITVVLTTNSEFTDKAKETSAVVVDASAFDASDSDKAVATVSSITLSQDKKEATVKFSLTAKKTVENGALKFTIPAVDSQANEIVKDAQDTITVGGETVTVTAQKPSVKATVTPENGYRKANKWTTEGGEYTLTLEGATFKNANPNITFDFTTTGGAFENPTITRDSDTKVCKFTLKATTLGSRDNQPKDVTVTIPNSELDVSSTYECSENLVTTLKVTFASAD